MLPLAGDWTLDAFSAHLGDARPLRRPRARAVPAYRDYRRWAFESAALDLALRQAGESLHGVLGREPRPLTFGVSLRLGEPAERASRSRDRLEAYRDVRFKLDSDARAGTAR